jgi:chromosome partitioning protein
MIITICNFKGGVGKTTTCHALATAKGLTGNKVLMVDLDGQHSLSTSCDIDLKNQEITLCELFIAELDNVEYSLEDVNDSIIHLENVDILPCTRLLNDINNELTKKDNFTALKNILSKVKNLYDYIFIDCSPTNNVLTKNALISSDSVIIPVESYFLGSEGLYDFINTLEDINEEFSLNITIDGIILTMYQNTKICNSIRDYVKNSIEKKNQEIEIPTELKRKNIKVYKDVVPRSIKVSEAGLYGKSIIEYMPKNPVSKAYVNIASEIV